MRRMTIRGGAILLLAAGFGLAVAGCTPDAAGSDAAATDTIAPENPADGTATWVCGGLSALEGISSRAEADATAVDLTPEQLAEVTRSVIEGYAYFVGSAGVESEPDPEFSRPLNALKDAALAHPAGGEAVDAALSDLYALCTAHDVGIASMARPGQGG